MADVFSTVYPTQMDYFSQGFKQSSDIINTLKDVQNQDLSRQVQKMRYQQELQASPAIADLLKNFSQESTAQPTQQTSTTVAPQQPGQGGITAEGFANLSPIQQMEMMKQRPQYFETETVQPTPRERYDKMMGAISDVVARSSRDPKMIKNPTAMQDLQKFVTMQSKAAIDQFSATNANVQPYLAQRDPNNPARLIPLQKGGQVEGVMETSADGRQTLKRDPSLMNGGYNLQVANAWLKDHPTTFDKETGMQRPTNLGDVPAGLAEEVSGARARGTLTAQEKMIAANWTPTVIDNAANSYLEGQSLTQIGVPTRDPTGWVKAQVEGRAYQMAQERGMTDWTHAHASLVRAANQSALALTNKTVSAMTVNEEPAKAEAERILGKIDPKTGQRTGGLTDKVPRSDTLAANYGMFLEKKFEGIGDVQALYNSISAFTNEYARVIEANGGAAATTVSGRLNAESMVPALLGKQDLRTVIESMMQNMEVTLAARQDQLAILQENAKSGKLVGERKETKKDSKNPLGLDLGGATP